MFNTSLSEFADDVIPGLESERATTGLPPLENEGFPTGFPMPQWEAQLRRYKKYHSWYRGDQLNVTSGPPTSTGEQRLKFPLKINPIRNFSRKHASLLIGEVPDNPAPVIKNKMSVKPSLTKKEADEKMKFNAEVMSNIVNEVWEQSDGRAIIAENAILAQYLGGCFFQMSYVPRRMDLRIPIVVKKVKPDFVLPIWSSDSEWNLLEAYIVYRKTTASLEQEFNIKLDGAPYAVYVEHWTRNTYSITINGAPLVEKYTTEDGKKISIIYKNLTNPFGFVPIVYIPRMREGNFYGSSLVEDIEGLVKEFNGRMADTGTLIQRTAHRKWFGRNITKKELQQFDNGTYFTNLGHENPSQKHPPEIWPEDPPSMSEGIGAFNANIWNQLLREAGLGPIAFGEDEGSQRSALTLAFRMWPSTIVAKMQRILWEVGLRVLDSYILLAISKLEIKPEGFEVPSDFQKDYIISHDWLPMIPRDREALINEIVLLTQTGRMSPERALELLGDVPDEKLELIQIKNWLLFQAKLAAMGSPTGDKAGAATGSGAAEDVQTPVASSGLSDNA